MKTELITTIEIRDENFCDKNWWNRILNKICDHLKTDTLRFTNLNISFPNEDIQICFTDLNNMYKTKLDYTKSGRKILKIYKKL